MITGLCHVTMLRLPWFCATGDSRGGGDIPVLEGAAESIEQFVGAARLGGGDPDKQVDLLGEVHGDCGGSGARWARIASALPQTFGLPIGMESCCWVFRVAVVLSGTGAQTADPPGDILLLYGAQDRPERDAVVGLPHTGEPGLIVLQRQ